MYLLSFVLIFFSFKITGMKECHYCLGITSVGVRMFICFVSMYHCFSTIISLNKSHENKFYRINFIFERKNNHHTRTTCLVKIRIFISQDSSFIACHSLHTVSIFVFFLCFKLIIFSNISVKYESK